MKDSSRFRFIGHALDGIGGFRPTVTSDSYGKPSSVTGQTYLIPYPRESSEKFARRNQLAFYASPVARITSRFTSYIAMKPVIRDVRNQLLKIIEDDCDGMGNSIDVFFQSFMIDAKARGSHLLLIDMPNVEDMPESQADQINQRKVPIWTPIKPDIVTDWDLLDNGTFSYVEFSGTYRNAEGKQKACTWRYDEMMWQCIEGDKVISEGEHNLGVCPIIAFTESGPFPNFGPFASISDLAKRLFNLESELDEILRAQTFSILTLQIPPDTDTAGFADLAKATGETISTENLMLYKGTMPGFVAPPDGPAQVYRDRIKDIKDDINEIGLDVATISQQESGVAMQFRFQAINAELSKFAARMEDFERRAWELTTRWLGLDEVVEIQWPRDFNIADPEQEIGILSDMTAANMPPEVIIEQKRRVIVTQFSGTDPDQRDMLLESLKADQSAL